MLTALSLAAALSAQSQTPPTPAPPPPGATFERRVMVLGGPGGEGPGSLDKDGDGQISREEFAAPMNDAFGRMDTNGDGRLSDEELKAGHGGPDEAGNVVFMRHPGPAGPGAEDHMVFMRHPGPGGPESPGVHRFELRREPGENGEERIRVFTRGENGEMTEVEGGVDGMNLPDGAHVRMLPGGDGEREITIVRRGGPGGDAPMPPMPPVPPVPVPGGGDVMVWTTRDGGAGEQRVEIRTMGGPGHGGAMEMHRMGGHDGPGDMDKDGDGRVTEEEFLAPMREAFRQMDADHSGAIDASEHGEGERRVHVITRTEERRSGE